MDTERASFYVPTMSDPGYPSDRFIKELRITRRTHHKCSMRVRRTLVDGRIEMTVKDTRCDMCKFVDRILEDARKRVAERS